MANVIVYASGLAGPAGEGLASVGLVEPESGDWFYAELVADGPRVGMGGFRGSDSLTLVPGTTFASSHAQLAAKAKAWIEARSCVSIRTRCLDPILPMLDAFVPVVAQLDPEKPRVLIFEEICTRSRPNVFPHALLDAMSLAIADPYAFRLLQIPRIQHLELVLGTKPAQSLRAWLRRLDTRGQVAHEESVERQAPKVVA